MAATTLSFYKPNKRKKVSEIETRVLPPGRYRAEFIRWLPGQRNTPDAGMKPSVTFVFKTESPVTEVTRTVTASTDIRSRLLEFVRSMGGSKPPTSEQLGDEMLFSEYLDGLIHNRYDLQLEPSPNNRYNNIVALLPVEKE